jgi:hypothetical protein
MKSIPSYSLDEAPVFIYEDDAAVYVLSYDFSRGIPKHLKKDMTFPICEYRSREQAYKEAYNFIVKLLNKMCEANLNTI